MELKIAREGEWRPRMLGWGSSVSSDILAGRDEEIAWEDVFVGKLLPNPAFCFDNGGDGMVANMSCLGDELRDVPDFHTEMEGRLRMNW
jgi:proteasome maturation protein